MDWFDREQLTATLKAAHIRIDEETISKTQSWLFTTLLTYQTRRDGYDIGRSKPSKELIKLDEALRNWINSPTWRAEARIIAPGHAFHAIAALKSLSSSISDTLSLLKSVKKRTRQEDLETDLARDLYWGYCELSGRKELSDDGPAIKFIKNLLLILDVPFPENCRRRLQQSIARNKSRRPIEIEGMAWINPIEILRGGLIINSQVLMDWKNSIANPEEFFQLENNDRK